MRVKISLLAVVSLAFASPPPSDGYLRDDHNYSVRVILHTLKPPMDGEVLAGLCAQLPDEAPEISAIDVYRRLMKHPVAYAGWVIRKKGPVHTVGRMITIHQLQHGLTGGNPEAVRQVAQNIIRDVADQLKSLPADARQQKADAVCALGFAFHLYGDAFSHQMIQNPDQMYRTGIGHLFDASKPDLPLYSRSRLALWNRYLSTLPGLIPHSELADIKSLFQEIDDSQRLASRQNEYNLAGLRKLVLKSLELGNHGKPFIPFDRSLRKQGCQAIIDRQAGINGITPAPDCERTWALYRQFAVKEYELYDQQHPKPAESRTNKSSLLHRIPVFERSPMVNSEPHHRRIRSKARFIHFGMIPMAILVPVLWIYWAYGACQDSESACMVKLCGLMELVPLIPALIGTGVLGLILGELVRLGVKHYEEMPGVRVHRPRLVHAVHGYHAIDAAHRRHVLWAAAQVILVSAALIFWLIYEAHHSTH